MDDLSDKNKRTVFCGGLPVNITDVVLYELFLQAGPIESLHLVGGIIIRQNDKKPEDSSEDLINTASRSHPRAFAFITFKHQRSVAYAISLLNGIRLYGHPAKVSERKLNATNEPEETHRSSLPRRRQSEWQSHPYYRPVHNQRRYNSSYQDYSFMMNRRR